MGILWLVKTIDGKKYHFIAARATKRGAQGVAAQYRKDWQVSTRVLPGTHGLKWDVWAEKL